MSEFLRLKIDMTAYHRVVRFLDILESDGFDLADALSGRGSNNESTRAIQDFLFDNSYIWHCVGRANRESPTGLSFKWREADAILKHTEASHISAMRLFDVLRLLRAMTGEDAKSKAANEKRSMNDQIPNPARDARLALGNEKGLLKAALRRLEKLCELTPEDIETVLALKRTIDSLTIEEFQSWNGWDPMDLPDGGQVLHVPYPEYHPVVREWTVAVFCTPFYINPYRGNPPDTGGTPKKFIGIGSPGRPTVAEFFAEADLDDVRQFMALIIRVERFCDGNIAGEFESGVIQGAFARLVELYSQSQGS